MTKFKAFLLFAVVSATTAGEGYAQANKQTATAAVATAETCKPICAKAQEIDLIDEKEQTAYRDCFIKRLCEAGRIIYPLAKDTPPPNFLEFLLGGSKEYKG